LEPKEPGPDEDHLRYPAGRFEVTGRIARGGIGVVLRGRDPDLGREVAVKVLRQRHLKAPGVVQRFVEEAQIGGQLQHPGIVPVYELGLRVNGQPFFAMKLVRGETLAALLDARRDSGDDSRKILSIFERVCQTVAYAHARGVVHRDLKPSNVMVGRFGEIQVIDWGFAKVLPRGGVADELPAPGTSPEITRIATVRTESDGAESQVGSVMGTPAYMPPEQALGQVDALDERSDVFALGAILCEILTGRSPYVPEDGDVVVQAAAGRLDDAWSRLDACGGEPEMTALCRSCLAATPATRPRHAGAVADAVAGHLAEVEARAQRARIGAIEERARATRAKVRAEEARDAAAAQRRRRRQVRALAAAVLLALAVLGGGWLVSERERAERIRSTETSVEKWLDEALQLQQEGSFAGAVEAATRACELAAKAGISTRLRQQAGQRLAEGHQASDAAAREKRDAALLERLEAIRIRTGDGFDFDPVAADLAFHAAFLQADLDLAAASAAAEIRSRLGPGAIASALRDWARLRDRDARVLEELADAVAPGTGQPDQEGSPHAFWLALNRARSLMQLEPPQAGSAVRFYLAALAHKPDHACLWHQLGVAYRTSGDYERELRALRRAAETSPRHAGHELLYGIALEELGLQDEAMAAYRRAVALDAEHVDAAHRLGVALQQAGSLDEAVELLRSAVRIQPQRARLHFALANALFQTGDTAGAAASYRAAAALAPRDAAMRNNLGVALLRDGLPEQALAALRKAVELDPNCREARYNLGLALHAERAAEDGIPQLREALAWDGDRKPSHAPWGTLLADGGSFVGAVSVLRAAITQAPKRADLWCDLGDVHRRQRKFGVAVGAFDRAITLEPRNGRAHTGRGMALLRLGRRGKSLAALRRGVELLPEEALAHSKLGYGLAKCGKFDAALAPLRRALELDPALAEAHFFLGVCFDRKGSAQEAAEWIGRSLELDPARADAQNAFSVVLCNSKQDSEAAIRASHAAVRLRPRAAQFHCNLGNALRENRDGRRAADEYRRAIDLDPKFAAAYSNLGVVLADFMDDHEGAIAENRKCLQHIPQQDVRFQAMVHRNLGMNLRMIGDMEGALAANLKAVQIDRNSREAWVGYASLLVHLGDFAKATPAYREAVRCEPRRIRTRVALGECLVAEKNYGEAIRVWRETCERAPNDPRPTHKLAWLLATCPDPSLRRPEQAVTLAEHAVALDPQTVSVRTLGAALYSAGRYAEALATLEQASAQYLDGGGAPVRICLAMAHYRVGHAAEARQWCRSAAALLEGSSGWNREYFRRLLEEARRLLAGDDG
jgi:serine/threonine-protein kinase